jgi:serine/threonine protein kinase/Flp pilus assembly protein TadD
VPGRPADLNAKFVLQPMPDDKEIFAQALDLPPVQRAEFLANAFPGDRVGQVRMAALLLGHQQAGGFLGVPVAPRHLTGLGDNPPEMIGRYKVLEKIGEGGCGVVYLAEQQEPVRRRVALKVIKLGMDTNAVVARFEAERQALALMDHPNIARVFDAGATENGRPYFVMELVHGISITKYCDQCHLTLPQRIGLFMIVCAAIQHAHQKGIIHRDLKPSNILVTVNDGVPVPKVIDFGVAKATQGRLTDQTVYTAVEQFIGTPAYMSPEQANLSGLDVDSRSDIYSLGVLLYELLAGRPPFDPQDFARVGVDEIRRQIREVEPPRPSLSLRNRTEADGTAIAKSRGSAPADLVFGLRGDLDWIVMRCLEKDRTRRYESAQALALDLQRHLRHEPVAARPPRPTYLLGKFLRRHRPAVVMAGGAVAVLAIGAALSFWRLNRADRAVREQSQLREAAQLALAALPARSDATDPTARALALYTKVGFLRVELTLAEDLARRGTEREPESAAAWGVRAGVQSAWLFRGWDLSDQRKEDTQTFANHALALDPNEPEALLALGFLLRSQGATEQAETLLRRAIAANPGKIRLARALGATLYSSGRTEAARAVFLEVVNRAPGEPLPRYELAMTYASYNASGADPKKLSAALEQLDAAIAIQPFYSALLLKAVLIGGWRGDLAEMQTILDQVDTFPLADRSEDRTVCVAMWAGLIEHRPDRVEAAAPLTARTYFDDQVMPFRPKAWSLALAHRLAGKENVAREDWQEAEAVLRERLKSAPDNPRYEAELAITLAWLGRREEAARLIGEVEPLWKEAPARQNLGLLALYYGALGDAQQALPYLSAAIDSSPFWSKRIIPFDPWWDKIRGRPEFAALLTERQPQR